MEIVMKGLMFAALAGLFLMVGCNEQKQEPAKVSETKTAAQPVVPVQSAKPAPAAETAAEKAGVKSVDWEQAKKMVAAGGIYVDVRAPHELKEGFAPYALNLPLNEMSVRYNELPKDKDLLIYCRSGRRSEAATIFLMKNGYERVYNVLGGFLAYPRNK